MEAKDGLFQKGGGEGKGGKSPAIGRNLCIKRGVYGVGKRGWGAQERIRLGDRGPGYSQSDWDPGPWPGPRDRGPGLLSAVVGSRCGIMSQKSSVVPMVTRPGRPRNPAKKKKKKPQKSQKYANVLRLIKYYHFAIGVFCVFTVFL